MSVENANLLSNNRSEHIGLDVWSEFVVPFSFKLSEFYSLQPIKLEGGRGSGKTMILRYLSHYSQFSPNRESIPLEAINNIGIYLKSDTQFMRLLQKRGIDENIWSDIFEHYLNLIISIEILSAFISIKNSNIESRIKEDVNKLEVDCFEIFGIDKTNIDNALKELKKLKQLCEKNVSNPRNIDQIEIIPYQIINELIQNLKISSDIDTTYHVYIDEYENLLEYQQKVINARMKHSEPPLSYNIAIKCNGAPFIDINGSKESLNLQHDYIKINLDDLMINSFEVFSSEILLSRLSKKNESYRKIFENIKLNEISDLSIRLDKNYQENIIKESKDIFPNNSHDDLAKEVFTEKLFFKKLIREIEYALIKHNTQLTAKDFLETNLQKEIIVCSSLLYRKKLSPESIYEELIKATQGLPNDFTDGKEWTSNNFIGCYIRISKVQKHKATFYAGLTAFTKLANGNIRYFLELCRSTFSNNFSNNETGLYIPKTVQHQAALETSELFFQEIDSMKPVSTSLKSFCMRLGTIFSLYHDRNSQSEAEINHFTIVDPINIDHELQDKINEAVKWGIVYQTKATKEKDPNGFIPFYDYVLNPIFSPHFYISYRKKRKTGFTCEQVKMLFESDQEEFLKFINDLELKLNPIEPEPTPEQEMQQVDLFE
ncbi:hypothetical protein F971_00142 [Acinetobacter vivianii]|uniref:Uncharacterized protein n=1 Tax=Acinetobacter vivianii TaxID=1776742 RepID=N8V3R3_9GAMM|nr:hypothetical protein [Acinetobacter vivianii]ENU94245.1 hypothetical protein F971_00142 [Acinetobacter vivianii]